VTTVDLLPSEKGSGYKDRKATQCYLRRTFPFYLALRTVLPLLWTKDL